MKKSLFPEPNEFYVGYQPQAPALISWFITRVVTAIGVIIVGVSMILVFYQRDFSTATFEYGETTSIEGYIVTSPIPHLKLLLGKDLRGNELQQNLLLVGLGKEGVDSLLHQTENRLGTRLDGKHCSVKGYLIYGDGKALLQINNQADITLLDGNISRESTILLKSLGKSTISGEVIDPKCFFGVMKPSEGKVHRSCAIRCIAGGIPPVFKSDMSDYYLLTGENFEPVNQKILGIVGDRVGLNGELVEFDDWKIFKVNTSELETIARAEANKKNLAALENGMTFCSAKK
jgi:hypothetical protein